uniref:MADF domain-containing protein n=1 Tax=Anopheles farauti TaxID=69004 RepID=A0A182QUR4_9DIPT
MEERKFYKRRSIEMSTEDTLRLISEIQKRRCLWDRTHESHKSRKTRDESWNELSLAFNHDADDLFEKWKSLRSSYRQYKFVMRKRANESVTGRIHKVQWPFYSAMHFTNYPSDDEKMPILPLAMTSKPIKRRIEPSRPIEPEFVKVEVDSLFKPPSPESPLESTASLLNPVDEDAVYGQSIGLQIKQFSPRTKRKLQIEIHGLIAKAQKEAFEKQFGESYDS